MLDASIRADAEVDAPLDAWMDAEPPVDGSGDADLDGGEIDASIDASVDAEPLLDASLADTDVDAFVVEDMEIACDPARVATISSTPLANATHVSLRSEVTIELGGDVVAESVTAESVVLLLPHATMGIDASVSYSAPLRRITITPRFALAAWSTYRVRVTGLDSGCGTVPDFGFDFETRRTSWTSRETYDSAGAVASGELHELDFATWRVRRQRAISGVGMDGIFGTTDDDVWYQQEYAYSGDESLLTATGPGTDNMLGTPDDVITYVGELADDPASNFSATFDRTPGDDMMWFTVDDGYATLFVQYFDARGAFAGYAYYADAGADGVPLSGDEASTGYARVVDVSPGVRQVHAYFDPGMDGTYETEDDVLTSIVEWRFDSDNHLTSQMSFLAGMDGLLDTDDDVYAGSGLVILHDPITGLRTQERTLFTAGPDAMWLTDDDVFAQVAISHYDAELNQTDRLSYFRGPDLLVATSDDTLFDRVWYAAQP